MSDRPLTDRRAIVYYALVVCGAIALVVVLHILGPREAEAYQQWIMPEEGFAETINLLFVAVSFFASLALLRRVWRRPTFVRRLLWTIFLFVWLCEESQYGQSIFHFATPSWWYGAAGKQAFDIHSVPPYGCALTLALVALLTGLIIAEIVRAVRGDRWARLFCFAPALAMVSDLTLPVPFLALQLFFSYWLAMVLLFAWRRGAGLTS
ncbi:MAG TPA: hypothetical protein PKW95_09370 [bacterium]|nr:hypothetical protein [bacterium]